MVLARLRELLESDFGIDGAAVTPELTLYGDLEFDEIEIYDLVMSVEDDFGIELPDEALEDMKTVGDLVSYVAKSIG